MQKKTIYVFAIVGFVFVLAVCPVIAQEDMGVTDPATAPAAAATTPTAAPGESDVQWVWGDVVSVDPQAKSLVVKYLDYDTDLDKDMNIIVNDQTVFENIKSLEEIKPQDTVSVDYAVSSEGKNIAKNIGLEKIEDETAPAPEEAIAPEKVGTEPTTETKELPSQGTESENTPAAPAVGE